MANRPGSRKITAVDQDVWTLVATIALWVLIISLGTLIRIWMLFSGLLSRRQDKPVVTLHISTIHVFDRDPLLRVNVMNTSSAPLTVTSIYIWTKWQQGGKSGGRPDDPVSRSGGEVNSITGPPLPFSIDGLYSQSWTLDLEWPKLSMIGVREVMIEVRVAPDKSTTKTIKLRDHFSRNEIRHLTRYL